MSHASLVVVGTGYRVVGQTTREALEHIKRSDHLFFLVTDQVSDSWLRRLNPTAESLADCYEEGRHGIDASNEMVERIVSALGRGSRVCAAFYGHPANFIHASHEAIRRARLEGLPAKMLPGISAQDCLFADLGVEPSRGCQSFEATDFLVNKRRFDPSNHLILLQSGSIGLAHYQLENPWRIDRLRVLVEVLEEHYPAEHEVIVYEASPHDVFKPVVEAVELRQLPHSRVTPRSTIYIPPLAPPPVDEEMVARLREVTGGQ